MSTTDWTTEISATVNADYDELFPAALTALVTTEVVEAKPTTEDAPAAKYEPVKMTRAERVKWFVGTVFNGCDQYLNLWADSKQSTWHRASDLEAIADSALWLNEDNNVWYQTGLMPEIPGSNKRGSEKEVAAITCLHSDLDYGTSGHKKHALPPDLDSVLALLDKSPLKPSLIIHSGNGVQAYWLLDKPYLTGTPAERENAKDLLKRLQQSLIVDHKAKGWSMDSTFDLVRLYRIPGTYNLKDKSNPKPVRVLLDNHVRYSIGEIDKNYPSLDGEIDFSEAAPIKAPIDRPLAVSTVEALPIIHSDYTDQQIVKAILENERNALLWESQQPQYASRSEQAMAICNAITRYTWNAPQVERIAANVPFLAKYPKWRDAAQFRGKTIGKAIDTKRIKFERPLSPLPVDMSAIIETASGEGIELSAFYDPTKLKNIEWLWERRFMLGGFNMLSAIQGIGKSTFLYYMIACLSTGTNFPDGAAATKCKTLILSCEDNPEDSAGPKLEAAGADHTMVKQWPKAFDLKNDLTALEATLKRDPTIKLVIIEPIYEQIRGDGNGDTKNVTAQLELLQKMAQRRNVCIIGVSHFKKGTGLNSNDATIGSMGYTAKARINQCILKSKTDPAIRIVAVGKANANCSNQALQFRIETVYLPNPQEPKGKLIETCKCVFLSEQLTTTADELMDQQKDQKRTAKDAEEWIPEYLDSVGGECASEAVITEGKEAGYTFDQLRRAKDRLVEKGKMKNYKKGMQGKWFWKLFIPVDKAPSLLGEKSIDGI